MLGVKAYPNDYIKSCRARVNADLASYRSLSAPSADFAASYFNNLVLVLDVMFVHRLRTVEGKDGNAMNEVRVLVDSLLLHGGVFTADKSIKLVPSRSVLGLEFGDNIALSEAQFVRLFEAFFHEIEAKFSEHQVAATVS